MDASEQKEKLRKELLERRARLPENEFLTKSQQICSTLRASSLYKNAETIHCYVSMNDRREVNTHPLIQSMLKEGKQVVVPVTEFESGTMRRIKLESFGQLSENKWGVLEPQGGKEVSVSDLNLVIVPMVGGDRQKNRIGYGKGFYDRFLAETDCPAIGLLFETCLIDEIPAEPFDISLDKLITESGLR